MLHVCFHLPQFDVFDIREAAVEAIGGDRIRGNAMRGSDIEKSQD
jgi:hypothetical protein